MLWTLVYIVMAQSGGVDGGTPELTALHTETRFATQKECIRVADTAAPGLLKAQESYIAPGNVGGKPPYTVTLRPLCVPAATK